MQRGHSAQSPPLPFCLCTHLPAPLPVAFFLPVPGIWGERAARMMLQRDGGGGSCSDPAKLGSPQGCILQQRRSGHRTAGCGAGKVYLSCFTSLLFWAFPLTEECAGLQFPARSLPWYLAQLGAVFGCLLSLLICYPLVLQSSSKGGFPAGAHLFHKPGMPLAMHRKQRGPVPNLTQFGVHSPGPHCLQCLQCPFPLGKTGRSAVLLPCSIFVL